MHEIPVPKIDQSLSTPKDSHDERDAEKQTVKGKVAAGDQRTEAGQQGREDPLDATRQFQAMHPSADLPSTARGAQLSAINARLQAEAGSGTPSAQPLQVTVGDRTFTGVLSGPRQGQQPELVVPGQPPQRFVVDTAGNQFLMHPVNKDGTLGQPIKPDLVRPAADAFSAHQPGNPVRVSDLQQKSNAADGAKFYSDYSHASPQDRTRLAESFAANPNRDALAKGMQEAAQRDPNAKQVLDSLTKDVQVARERMAHRTEDQAPVRSAERSPETDKPTEVRTPTQVAQTEATRQAITVRQNEQRPDAAALKERELTGSTDRVAPERVVSRVETTVASTTGPHPSTADVRHVAFTNSNDGRVQQIMLQGRATVFTQSHEVDQATARTRALSDQAAKRPSEAVADQAVRVQAHLAADRGGRDQAHVQSDQAALKGRTSAERLDRLDTRVLPNQLAQRIQELTGKGVLLSAVAARLTEVKPPMNAFDALRNAQAAERIPAADAAQALTAGARAPAERPMIPGLNLQDNRDRQFVAEAIKQLLSLRLPEFNPRIHDVRTLLQGLDAGKVGKLQEFLTNESAGTRTGALTQQQFIGRLNDILVGGGQGRPPQNAPERIPLDAASVAALRASGSRPEYLVNLMAITSKIGGEQGVGSAGLKEVIGRAMGDVRISLGVATTFRTSQEQMELIRDLLLASRAKEHALSQKNEAEKEEERHEAKKLREEKSKDTEDDQPKKLETLKVNRKNEALLAELKAKKLREQKEKEMRDRELALAQMRKNEENTRRRRYVIRERDTLQSIALRQLRDVRLASLIYQINKSLIPVTTQRGKKVYVLKVGQVILLPSGNEVKGFRGKEVGMGLSQDTQEPQDRKMTPEEELLQLQEEQKFASAEDELAAKFGANWDGAQAEEREEPISDAGGKAAPAAGMRVGKFGRSMGIRSQMTKQEAPVPVPETSASEAVEARTRRAHVEEMLGPVSREKPVDDGGRIKYVVRLGDTLKSVCVKHPALQDVSLWVLLAQVNDIDSDTEAGAQSTRLPRGAVLMLPSPAEIAEFRSANRPTAHATTSGERAMPKCISCGSVIGAADTVCGACHEPAFDRAKVGTVRSVSAKEEVPDAATIIMQAAGFMSSAEDEDESRPPA
jgi:hypothetical protein